MSMCLYTYYLTIVYSYIGLHVCLKITTTTSVYCRGVVVNIAIRPSVCLSYAPFYCCRYSSIAVHMAMITKH